jgi:hypothetical protein
VSIEALPQQATVRSHPSAARRWRIVLIVAFLAVAALAAKRASAAGASWTAALGLIGRLAWDQVLGLGVVWIRRHRIAGRGPALPLLRVRRRGTDRRPTGRKLVDRPRETVGHQANGVRFRVNFVGAVSWMKDAKSATSSKAKP